MKDSLFHKVSIIAALVAASAVGIAEYFSGVSSVVTLTSFLCVLIFTYAALQIILWKTAGAKANRMDVVPVDFVQSSSGQSSNETITDSPSFMAHEITELKKLESFRKEFLGNVSHELKTPIFNIQGYIHTLLDGALTDDEVNVQYLKRAARSADRLSLIVDDLEAISKFETGELILDQRTFDIHELMKDVYDSNELIAREKNMALRFKEGSEQPFYVYADKERVRQILVNLVTNSIKYGKKDGITTASFSNNGDQVIVEISDNGIGIEQQHLTRVFERFYRVDKSRSREAGGTGLGLAIVKHIIEAHKQTIIVKSVYGYGTAFTFTLKKAR